MFEALVKSAKKALRAILGESRTTDEELLTALVEVEGIFDSRLLSYCSSDPNDENVLTTNHFLYGQMGVQLAPKVADEITFNPRNRWRFIQDLITKCWRRLMKEYLSTRNTRNKWVEEKRRLLLVLWSWWWILATHEGIGLWVEFEKFFLALMGRSELFVLEQEAKITCDRS